jgi:hypothetical protein
VTLGTSLLLIAIGAVLKWAVTAHTNGFNIHAAGTILFVIGLIGLPLSLLYTLLWSDRDRGAYTTRDPRYGPPQAP